MDENEKSVLTCAYDTKSEPHTQLRWRKDGKLMNAEENGELELDFWLLL